MANRDRARPLGPPLWGGVNGERMRDLSTPSASLVPLSQRDSWLLLANAITHFLPLRQAGVPRRGEGVDKTPLATKRQSADTGHHWGACGLCILCKKNALGLKSSPSRSCCRISLPLWCRSADRCISWLCRRWQRHGPPLCRQWCKPPLRYSVQHR